MSAFRDVLRDLPNGTFFDLLESDDAYLLVVDVPGATADTVDVAVGDRRLHVDARREKGQPSSYRYVEETRATFNDLSVPLPTDADPDGVETAVDRGVLEVHLPKRDGDAETTITVVEDSADGDDSASADGERDPADAHGTAGSDPDEDAAP